MDSALEARTHPGVTSRGYRAITLVTVIAVFALITMGGIVRITDSGLACPDWPLCHGKIIPPLDGKTLIEYSHRLAASAVSGLVLAVAVLTLRFHRREPWLLIPAVGGLLLIGGQVVVGGVTVLTDLSSISVVVHLALAQALLGSMVVIYVTSIRVPKANNVVDGAEGQANGFAALSLVTAIGLYGLLLLGAYVAVSGATTACSGWPLCQGSIVPEGRLPQIHMAHRIVALATAILMAATVAVAVRRWRWQPDLAKAALVVGIVFLIQVFLGAAMIWLKFSDAIRVMHLSTATLVWGSLAILATMALAPLKTSSEK